MHDHHYKRAIDPALRLAGAALCGLSWAAIHTLVHMRLVPWPASPGALPFALAAIGFVCASAGTALVLIGQHILDRIEIGERWRKRVIAERRIEAALVHPDIERGAE